MRRTRIRHPRRSSERDERALNNSPPSRGCNRLVAASKTYIIITTAVYGQSRNGFY